MHEAHVRAYAALNDFLPPQVRHRTIVREFWVAPSVKDIVESTGIPHPEVDLVIVNGRSAGWHERVRPGDRIAVFPRFTTLDVSHESQVRPEPVEPSFVADAHLGRLARNLRLLGFDTLHQPSASDDRLADWSAAGRILLTRDRAMLRRGQITHGYCVRSAAPEQQLAEVVERFDLPGRARPFTRCTMCNRELAEVAKADIAAEVPPGTLARFDDYRRCPGCRRIYWAGAHHARLSATVERALRPSG